MPMTILACLNRMPALNSPSNFQRPAVATLVLPLLVELSLGLVVGLVGTIWAARISDAAGGSFALTNHVFGFLFMVFRLVGAGVSVVISQNLGAGDRREADRIARAALAWGTWMGGLVALCAGFGAAVLVGLLGRFAEFLLRFR